MPNITRGEMVTKKESIQLIKEEETGRLRAVGYLVFNLVSTIAVININKWVFMRMSFGYPAALSNIHYLVSWLGVYAIKVWSPSIVPALPVQHAKEPGFILMVILIGVVTPLNNTALKLNSTGFYQIAKIAVTPVVVLIEFFLDGKLPSLARGVCLVLVCFCVLLMAIFSTKSKQDTVQQSTQFYGLLAAALWIPLAAGYKVQWGRLLNRRFHCSTLSLMFAIFPKAIAIQTCLIPLVDPPGLWQYEWTLYRLLYILISGLAAFAVNVSGFLVLGRAGGAIAHILLGQCKASGAVLLAAIIFGERYSTQEFLAASGAILAIVAYSLLR